MYYLKKKITGATLFNMVVEYAVVKHSECV